MNFNKYCFLLYASIVIVIVVFSITVFGELYNVLPANKVELP